MVLPIPWHMPLSCDDLNVVYRARVTISFSKVVSASIVKSGSEDDSDNSSVGRSQKRVFLSLPRFLGEKVIVLAARVLPKGAIGAGEGIWTLAALRHGILSPAHLAHRSLAWLCHPRLTKLLLFLIDNRFQ